MYLRNSLPLGIDKLFKVWRADYGGWLPIFMLDEFRRYGKTYVQDAVGRVIFTIEPGIIRAVLKTQKDSKFNFRK